MSNKSGDGRKKDREVEGTGIDSQSNSDVGFPGTGITCQDEVLSILDEVNSFQGSQFALGILGKFFFDEVLELFLIGESSSSDALFFSAHFFLTILGDHPQKIFSWLFVLVADRKPGYCCTHIVIYNLTGHALEVLDIM